MIDLIHRVAHVVMAIEAEMRRLHLWEDESPSQAALASQQPFCFDTLRFTQWLQWIFIPRMKHIMNESLPLPVDSGIAPMAEECLRELDADATYLLTLIRRFDELIVENRKSRGA